jgi:hypothetical protein
MSADLAVFPEQAAEEQQDAKNQDKEEYEQHGDSPLVQPA